SIPKTTPLIPFSYSGTSPLTPTPKTTSHLITPLMRQSLQASKAGQSMKKAEEELENERILMVLKSRTTTGTSPTRRGNNESDTSCSGSEERKLPPLPRRKPSNSISSGGSGARSLDQIATAGISYSKPSFRGTSSSRSSSPSKASVDLPPPRHPD